MYTKYNYMYMCESIYMNSRNYTLNSKKVVSFN